jgi:rhodanese-related sulfurtransferase
MNAASITPQQLSDLIQSGADFDLIDVRTPAEFRTAHIGAARNLPLDRLDPAALIAGRSPADRPLYVVCQSGNRSQKACQKIVAAGHAKVVNVEGGTRAWQQAGLPVVRGKQTISLERQVRIGAGLLVLIGCLLAATVHPYWIGLAALIGAGLVFAGITDFCGMAMLLARMPWNQADPADGSAAAGAPTSPTHSCCR